MNGLMSFLGQPQMGGMPQQTQAQGLPPLTGFNPSVMQFLQAMMSQPGGNPFGAQSMGELPSFGTPWAGGLPPQLPQVQMPSAGIDPPPQQPGAGGPSGELARPAAGGAAPVGGIKWNRQQRQVR